MTAGEQKKVPRIDISSVDRRIIRHVPPEGVEPQIGKHFEISNILIQNRPIVAISIILLFTCYFQLLISSLYKMKEVSAHGEKRIAR